MDKKYQVFKLKQHYSDWNARELIALGDPCNSMEDAELALLNIHNGLPGYGIEYVILPVYTHK